jgi:hypothetical protein
MKKIDLRSLLLAIVCIVLFFFCTPAIKAQQYGVVFGNNVNIREEPSSKSKLVGKILENMTRVNVESNNYTSERISFGNCNIEYYWYEINQDDKLRGWLYGAYIIAFETADSAMDFIDKNIAFRNQHTGKYTLDYNPGDFSTYYELELLGDGTITFDLSSVQGDHIISEKGNGRFYFNTKNNTFNFYGSTSGEFSPDFYSWEEYFTMAKGHKPTKEELEKYINEESHYKCYCEVKDISMESFNELMKPVK